jgi:hypothetical protein
MEVPLLVPVEVGLSKVDDMMVLPGANRSMQAP